MYQTDGQVAYVNVTCRSGDADRTDAGSVDTRSSIVTRDHLAQVHGAVGAHEAGKTAAQPGAVTRPVVMTRVVSAAVRRGAGASGVRWRTGTAVTGDQVRTGTAIETRPWRTVIYVDLTIAPCVVTKKATTDISFLHITQLQISQCCCDSGCCPSVRSSQVRVLSKGCSRHRATNAASYPGTIQCGFLLPKLVAKFQCSHPQLERRILYFFGIVNSSSCV